MTLILYRPTPSLKGNKNTIQLEEDPDNILLGRANLVFLVQKDADMVPNAHVTLTRFLDEDGKPLSKPERKLSITNEKGLVGFKVTFSLANDLDKQYVIVRYGDEIRTLWFDSPDVTSQAIPPRKSKIIVDDLDLPQPVWPSTRPASVPPPLPPLARLQLPPPKPVPSSEPPLTPESEYSGVPRQQMAEPSDSASASAEQLVPEGELAKHPDAILSELKTRFGAIVLAKRAELEQLYETVTHRFDTYTAGETAAASDRIRMEAEHHLATLNIEAGALSRLAAPNPPVPVVPPIPIRTPPLPIRAPKPRFQLTGSAAQLTVVLAVALVAIGWIVLH